MATLKKTPPPSPGSKVVKRRSSRKPAGRKWVPYTIPDIDVRLFAIDGPRREGVPAIDPDYVFREAMVREIAWAVWPHDNGFASPGLLVGPKGSGKTSLILQIAARCNIRVHRVNLNVGTTVRHLKGRIGAADGSTVFIPGVATVAMESGDWLLLDEVSGATPPVALSLFPLLEPDGAVYLEEDQPPRYVGRHTDFRVFATDNTIGAEQEDSRFSYGGTNPEVNVALLDRFDSCTQVGYMDVASEHRAILAKVPGIDPEDLEGMIRVANKIRTGTDYGIAFSFRMLVAWARRVAAGHMDQHGNQVEFSDDEFDSFIVKAAYPAFLRKMRSKMDRDSVLEVIRRIFDITGEVKDDDGIPTPGV